MKDQKRSQIDGQSVNQVPPSPAQQRRAELEVQRRMGRPPTLQEKKKAIENPTAVRKMSDGTVEVEGSAPDDKAMIDFLAVQVQAISDKFYHAIQCAMDQVVTCRGQSECCRPEDIVVEQTQVKDLPYVCVLTTNVMCSKCAAKKKVEIIVRVA